MHLGLLITRLEVYKEASLHNSNARERLLKDYRDHIVYLRSLVFFYCHACNLGLCHDCKCITRSRCLCALPERGGHLTVGADARNTVLVPGDPWNPGIFPRMPQAMQQSMWAIRWAPCACSWYLAVKGETTSCRYPRRRPARPAHTCIQRCFLRKTLAIAGGRDCLAHAQSLSCGEAL
jgi:hypothetical protein